MQWSTKKKEENKGKIEKKTNQSEKLSYHFRTTVNRRTLVGRPERTNDERVCAELFDVGDVVVVVTRQPLKSPVPSS